MNSDRIILASDELSVPQLLALGPLIGESLYAVKVHNHLDQHGPDLIKRLKQAGYTRVWADLKFHDIPNTVSRRAEAISILCAPDIVTVHASGEVDMMMAAVKAGSSNGNHFQVFAVTVLTSLDEEMAHLMYGQPSKAAALYLARLARLAGVHGVVCSPKEVGILAKRPELQDMKFITPGIRPVGKGAGDQKRVDTPTAAIKAGATHLVIGRAITEAPDPVVALAHIEEEIDEALTSMEGADKP